MYTIKSYKRFLNELRQSSTDTLDTPDKRIAAAEKSIADETERNKPSPDSKEETEAEKDRRNKEEKEEEHRSREGTDFSRRKEDPQFKDLYNYRSNADIYRDNPPPFWAGDTTASWARPKPDTIPPPHHVEDSYGHVAVNSYPRPLSFTPPKQRAAQPSKPVPLSWDPVAQVSKMAKDKPTGRQLPEVLPEVDPAPSTTNPAVTSEPWKRRTQHPNPSPSMEDSIRELSPYLFKDK